MSLFWKVADPLLMRVRRRLEHLEQAAPSGRHATELRSLGRIAPSALLYPEAFFTNAAPVEHFMIGEHACIRGEIRLLTSSSRIAIGDHSYVGPSTRIWAKESIEIGAFVLISHLVDVIDNNSHSFHWSERREELRDLFERGREIDYSRIESAPVVIGDDVWIGAKATILKGVRIGRGAVVAANSVVTSDVEPFTLVAGNPARVLRQLPEER